MAENKQPFDASDEESVRERNKSLKTYDGLRRDGLRHLVSAPNGRKWLYWLLELTHQGRISMHADAKMMGFLEGERNIGMQVMIDLLNHFPNEYQQMMKENQNAV